MKNGCTRVDDALEYYVIIRGGNELPAFLEVGTGGWFSGKEPYMPLAVIERNRLGETGRK